MEKTPAAAQTVVPVGIGKGLVLGGDFRLGEKLGSGGMGQVFHAHQISLDRPVAVKVSLADPAADPDGAARFAKETAALARFACPHIVPVLAGGAAEAAGGRKFGWMAMEYMTGGDLAGRLRNDGPPPLETGLRWLRQTLEGVAYAHRHGVIHRDLKPHNLFVTTDGDVKVGDFGLLRQSRAAADGATMHGTVLGTPYYMSPEQAVGERADERSDLYSVGATFFQVLTGRLPFDGTTTTAVLIAVAHGNTPRLADALPGCPRPLDLIVARLMAHLPDDRYQDARVVLEDLASYDRRGLLGVPPTDPPRPAGRVRPAAADPQVPDVIPAATLNDVTVQSRPRPPG